MHPLRRIPFALVLAAAAPLTSAQTVTVTGTALSPRANVAPPRAALLEACPQAAVDLPDALAATAQEVATASTVSVSFEIDGRHLQQLEVRGGVGRQARAVAWAVRHLGCSNGVAGRQRVQFEVRFLDPFARPGSAMALLEPGLR